MNSRIARITALLLAGSCAAAALKAGWVSFNLRRPVPGWHFTIGGFSSENTKVALCSYGVLAALLCAIGFLAFWLQRPRLLAWTAIGLLLLPTGAFLQVAFTDVALFQDLVSECRQNRGVEKFSRRNLPINLGTEPTGRRNLSTDTLGDRIAATQYFMGLGWYATVVAGLLGLIRGLRALPSARERWCLGLFASTACLALGGVCLIKPVRAQRTLARAVELESRGNLHDAVEQYRLTMQLDPWFAVDPSVHQRIGAIDDHFGRTNTIDYGIYRVELFAQQGDLPSAIAETEKLLKKKGISRSILDKRIAELWALQGRALYGAGAIGDAALAWQNALRYDANQLLAGFCLSCAYYDLGRYADCVDLVFSIKTKTMDPYFLSNLLSNQGDAYTKLGEFPKARVAYRKSYELDTAVNWRALSALVGGN